MTIQELLNRYPTADSELLLAHILKQDKTFLIIHGDKKVPASQIAAFKRLLKRRQAGEPYAYIVGHKYFHGLPFFVNKNVLIPRPETEWLVDRALALIGTDLKAKASKQGLEILDMGTGSGCIAITLATKLKNKKIHITAADISATALAVAKKNARFHKANISFIKTNLFSNLKSKKFDLIIANLPYVPPADYRKLKPGLRYEPKLALVAHNNFAILKNFMAQCRQYLNLGGYVLMEIDPAAVPVMRKHTVKSKGLGQLKFFKDLGKYRRYASLTH